MYRIFSTIGGHWSKGPDYTLTWLHGHSELDCLTKLEGMVITEYNEYIRKEIKEWKTTGT